jgi:uncharacterized protein (TIGR02246 family)
LTVNDEQAIRELIATWHRATVAGDLPRLLSLMAEDVVFLTPGQPPMRGKEAFAAGFRAAAQKFQIEPHGEIQEISVAGDWAYCWTRLSVTLIPRASGPALRRLGHTLTIFRKREENAWLLARDANTLTLDPHRREGAG